jgi:hypothetical protein
MMPPDSGVPHKIDALVSVEAPSATATDDTDVTAFRLLSVRASSAPAGSVGHNWLEYRIGQGPNVIKGYRRGDVNAVRADVEKIVIALNARRSSRSPAPANRGRPPAAAVKAEQQPGDE